MQQLVPDQRHFACPPFRRFTIFLIPTWLVVWCVCSISPFTHIVNRLSSIFSKNWGSVFRGYYEQGKNSRQDQAGSAAGGTDRRRGHLCLTGVQALPERRAGHPAGNALPKHHGPAQLCAL